MTTTNLPTGTANSIAASSGSRGGTRERAWPRVVLAPMAGITNAPFRRLCRSFLGGDDTDLLYVSEMITARGLVEGNAKTERMARFAADEPVRSIQLYGTDPRTMGEAVRILVDGAGADHIDLNFGCPVAKITRKGGGAALPVRRALFGAIVRAAVQAAGPTPVTVKLRLGVDDRHQTYLDAGRRAADEGVAAVALHARTAAQHYSGRADWTAIGELKAALAPAGVPVPGNGDIWRPADALAMMRATGCDGVVVGRGCLGRPWLFRDLSLALAGGTAPPTPRLGLVTATLRRHAHLLAGWITEPLALLDIRKHVGWYLLGYPVGGDVRRRLTAATTLDELDTELQRLEVHADLAPLPGSDTQPRGKTSGPHRVVLPDGWTDHPDDPTPLVADDPTPTSGG
jgi:nifR3 family TIM-barrel protein